MAIKPLRLPQRSMKVRKGHTVDHVKRSVNLKKVVIIYILT